MTPDPLERATYRVIHSLKRKAAGEHNVDTPLLMLAFSEEWDLDDSGKLMLSLRVMEFENLLSGRMKP